MISKFLVFILIIFSVISGFTKQIDPVFIYRSIYIVPKLQQADQINNKYYHMQLDFGFNANLDESGHWRSKVIWGYTPTAEMHGSENLNRFLIREYFVEHDFFTNSQIKSQAGLLEKKMGLDNLDHTSYQKNMIDFGTNPYSYGVSVTIKPLQNKFPKSDNVETAPALTPETGGSTVSLKTTDPQKTESSVTNELPDTSTTTSTCCCSDSDLYSGPRERSQPCSSSASSSYSTSSSGCSISKMPISENKSDWFNELDQLTVHLQVFDGDPFNEKAFQQKGYLIKIKTPIFEKLTLGIDLLNSKNQFSTNRIYTLYAEYILNSLWSLQAEQGWIFTASSGIADSSSGYSYLKTIYKNFFNYGFTIERRNLGFANKFPNEWRWKLSADFNWQKRFTFTSEIINHSEYLSEKVFGPNWTFQEIFTFQW